MLIGTTLRRANEYVQGISESLHLTELGILNNEAFNSILHIYMYGKTEEVVDYCLLKLVEDPQMEIEKAIEILRAQLRDTDYIGNSKSGEIFVLLTNTSHEEADFVKGRLADRNVAVEGGEDDHEYPI